MQIKNAAYHVNEGDDDGIRLYLLKMTLCFDFLYYQRYVKNYSVNNFFEKFLIYVNTSLSS